MGLPRRSGLVRFRSPGETVHFSIFSQEGEAYKIDQLFILYSKDRLTRFLLYVGIFLFLFSYGVTNRLGLDRPIESVSKEVIILAVFLTIGLASLYATKRSTEDQTSATVMAATLTVEQEARLFGAIALARTRLDFVNEELTALRRQFAMEYPEHRSHEELPLDRPFVITAEYQAGRILSVGSWGALLLACLVNFFEFQITLSLSLWGLLPLSIGVALSEFAVFRGMISVAAGTSPGNFRMPSKIALGSSVVSLMLLVVTFAFRFTPHPSQSIVAGVFALLSLVLPFCGASLSVSAGFLLWSYRIVELVEHKQNDVEKLEYEMRMLERMIREFEDQRKGASVLSQVRSPQPELG